MHTPTLLPLDTFREQVFAINPWHFWGFATDSGGNAQINSACNTPLRKYGWQTAQQAGREDIARAIDSAERRIFDIVGYWPAPRYTEQLFQFPRYPNPLVNRIGYAGTDMRWQSLNLREGYVQNIGVETRELIEADVTITRDDDDGDSLDERFSFTVTTTVTDPEQIAVYFSAADRFDGSAVSEKWRVHPVEVSIAGGVATITGRGWLVGKPVNYEGGNTENRDPTVDANFVTTLDVYRLYIDPTGTTVETAQARMIWETVPYPYFDGTQDPTNPSRDPAALAERVGRAGIRNAVTGDVHPAEGVYNADTGTWSAPEYIRYRPPDRVELRYQAGLALESGNMHPQMARVVARLAAAEFSQRITACEQAQRDLARWQRDMSRTTGPDQWGAINTEDLINPFGTLLGHIDAWKQIKANFRVLSGTASGSY